MRLDLIRDGVYLVGVPIIALLLWNIARRIRAIRDLDAKLRAEAALKPTDPYAELGRMMNDR